jgi:hypothetical protein
MELRSRRSPNNQASGRLVAPSGAAECVHDLGITGKTRSVYGRGSERPHLDFARVAEARA